MPAQPATSKADRDRFYEILGALRDRLGPHRLSDCHGRMEWPQRGVYFFFEDGELRRDGVMPRVVRVGTHAVSAGSKTTLWNRLSTHRGTTKGTGNHRGSIFRLHVGSALLGRGDVALASNTWGDGSKAPPEIRTDEREVEQAVSRYIGSMPFLWVQADDESGTQSIRSTLERNSIGLLSTAGAAGATADPASPKWLGRHASHQAVVSSSLWNVRETTGSYERGFLDLLERCASQTGPLGGG